MYEKLNFIGLQLLWYYSYSIYTSHVLLTTLLPSLSIFNTNTCIHVYMYTITLDFSYLKEFQERDVFCPLVISAPLWFSSSISLPSALRGRDVCFVMAITQKSLWWTPPALRSCTHWSPRSHRTGSAPWASSDPTEHKVRHRGRLNGWDLFFWVRLVDFF